MIAAHGVIAESALIPQSFPGLALYLTAQSGKGIIGGNLNTWTDQITGIVAQATSAATRPTLVNSLNGIVVPTFNGGNMLGLTSGLNMFRNKGQFTVFVISKCTTPTIVRSAFAANTPTEGIARVLMGEGIVANKTSIFARRVDGGGGASASSTGNFANAWKMQCGDFDFTNGVINQYINGTLDGTNTIAAGVTSDTASASIIIGDSATTSGGPYNGDIAMIAVYQSKFTAQQRKDFGLYQQKIWGLNFGS